MSELRTVILAFIIIATCGNSQTVRAAAWVMAIVCSTILLMVWLTETAFGIGVN